MNIVNWSNNQSSSSLGPYFIHYFFVLTIVGSSIFLGYSNFWTAFNFSWIYLLNLCASSDHVLYYP